MTTNIFPSCVFHSLTGLHCPGCGLTRGVHAFLNGEVLQALDYNVLLVFFIPIGFYLFLSLLSAAVRGRWLPIPKIPATAFWTLFVVMVVFGVVRNLPFYPFTVLAP